MTEPKLPPDPWRVVRTRHNFPADQLISALQKEIRRGNTENAALIAYELLTTSERLEDYLWKRLMVISVEDIGFGDLQAPVLVETLHRMLEKFDPTSGERSLLAIHAVRYLCSRRKDRSSDEMTGWIKHQVDEAGVLPEIPDYALDVHTEAGRAKGRGIRHFMEVGAQLNPELQERNTTYRDRLMTLLDESE